MVVLLFFTQYAVYRADSPPKSGYTGGMATSDVYNTHT